MAQGIKFGWLLSPRAIAIGAALAVGIPVVAFVAGPDATPPPGEVDTQIGGLAQVQRTARWEAEADRQPPGPITRVVAVESGDNLMGVLLRAGAERNVAHAAIQSLKGSYDPRRDLNIGDELQITFGPGTIRRVDSTETEDAAAYVLDRLKIPVSYDRLIDVSRNDEGGFDASEVERRLEREVVEASGKINSSLFVSASAAGIPARVLAELIRIYSFDVDFQRDIWQGDQFELMYEQFRGENGDIVHQGDIHYAKLTLRDTEVPLYRYTTTKGNLDYFNAKGESVRKTLMRTPIDGARLSSRFGKRKHPILGYTRLHAGVDFAAPKGTPIYAAGNGTIVRAGRNGGYGNYIRIRHNGTYQTAYAHLSKFSRGTRSGARVKQGQVIGYVGTTGRSTGPHLHYEVHRNGRQINPRTVRIPSGEKLKGDELKKFIAMRDIRDLEFARLRDGDARLVENKAREF